MKAIVGQQVYLTPCGNRKNRTADGSPIIIDAVVTAVGRKYYTVVIQGRSREYQFSIDELKQKTEYSSDYCLHLERQELVEQFEREVLTDKFADMFSRMGGKTHRLTTEQLRRIDAILKESEEQDNVKR